MGDGLGLSLAIAEGLGVDTITSAVAVATGVDASEVVGLGATVGDVHATAMLAGTSRAIRLLAMRIAFVVALLLLLSPASIASAAAPGPEQRPRLLVRFAPHANAVARASAIRSIDAYVDTDIGSIGITRLALRHGLDAVAAARLLTRDAAVAFAEPDGVVRTELVPNDALWFTDPYTGAGQWAWRTAQVDRAWDVAGGSPDVIVAVVDTGIDRGHPDLAGALLPGARFTSTLSSACRASDDDDNSHGTHIAGIIGANGNNGIGISGVAFGVRIMPIKALDCVGTGSTSDVAQGIVWATDHGARIVNVSSGTISDNITLRLAVRYAIDHGVLVVAAAGNCGAGGGTCISLNIAEYPAALPGVMAVAATTRDDAIASYSTRGAQIAIAAPGDRIVNTTPRYSTYLSARGLSSEYASLSGTSQASAFVAGVAALVLSGDKQLSAAAVATRIVATADDLGAPGRDDAFGAGRVNALRATSHADRSQGFAALYDARSVPHAAIASREFDASMAITNDSDALWRASGTDAVRLAYHWIDGKGRTVTWDGLRTSLPADVAPGSTVRVTARVLAPAEAAPYALSFDLVREGAAWYSQRGVEPAIVGVSVDRGFAAAYAPDGGIDALVGGAPAVLAVAVTNTGISRWLSGAVRLAYHWLRPDGTMVVWDGARAPAFSRDVAAGETAMVKLVVAPPTSVKGAFVLRLDLVEEGIAWFGDHSGGISDLGVVID